MSDPAPEAQKLEGRAEFAAAALSLVQSARRELLLLTWDFNRLSYGSEEFVEAAKRLVLGDEHARIRVLINQPRLAMQGAHRLIELGRQLPSRIEFRELLEERVMSHRAEWLINDHGGYLERREPDALYARYLPESSVLARQRAVDFRQLWDESPAAQELRVLGL